MHIDRITSNFFGILDEKILLDRFPKFINNSFSKEIYLKYIDKYFSNENEYTSNIIKIGKNTLIFSKKEVNLLNELKGEESLANILRKKNLLFSDVKKLIYILTYHNLIICRLK